MFQLQSDNEIIRNFVEVLFNVRYKVRKDVPRSKAIAEADWNTSTAKLPIVIQEIIIGFLMPRACRNPYVQRMQRRLTFRETK
ncbi:hypothetical protein ACWOBA_06805 [Gemella taiwanensis]